jgi:hypothetical protein
MGTFVEVDLEYPSNLHNNNTHNDLPLAVEKRLITYDMLSPCQKRMLEKFPEIKMSKVDKLVASFLPKTKYVCLLKNLQIYLSKGLILKKVHRILKADQSSGKSGDLCWNS